MRQYTFSTNFGELSDVIDTMLELSILDINDTDLRSYNWWLEDIQDDLDIYGEFRCTDEDDTLTLVLMPDPNEASRYNAYIHYYGQPDDDLFDCMNEVLHT